MTTREGPPARQDRGAHDDKTTVPPPCRNRADCEQVRREAACWRWSFTEEAVRERLAEEDALVLRRIRGASWDVSAEPLPKPEPWPADASVPRGFYPPRGAA